MCFSFASALACRFGVLFGHNRWFDVEPLKLDKSIPPSESRQAEPFEEYLSDMVATTIQMMDWRFFLDDKPLSLAMMSSNRYMLPAILWNAEKSYQQLLSRSIGVQFKSDPETGIGAQAFIGPIQGRPRSVFAVFCFETLCRAIESSPVINDVVLVSPEEVAEARMEGMAHPPRGAGANVSFLVRDFFEDHARGLVPWTPDSQPKSPDLSWTPKTSM